MQHDKLRRMIDAGYSQFGIAALLGIDIGTARRLVRSLRDPDDKPKPRHRNVKRKTPTDFQLRETPLSDHYTCNVGSDLYLEALRREHPDRAS